jgi:hypothetical protein
MLLSAVVQGRQVAGVVSIAMPATHFARSLLAPVTTVTESPGPLSIWVTGSSMRACTR